MRGCGARSCSQASDEAGPDVRGETESAGDRIRGLDNTKAEGIRLCCGQQAEQLTMHIWPAAFNRAEWQSLQDPEPLCFFRLVLIFCR